MLGLAPPTCGLEMDQVCRSVHPTAQVWAPEQTCCPQCMAMNFKEPLRHDNWPSLVFARTLARTLPGLSSYLTAPTVRIGNSPWNISWQVVVSQASLWGSFWSKVYPDHTQFSLAPTRIGSPRFGGGHRGAFPRPSQPLPLPPPLPENEVVTVHNRAPGRPCLALKAPEVGASRGGNHHLGSALFIQWLSAFAIISTISTVRTNSVQVAELQGRLPACVLEASVVWCSGTGY